MSMNYLAYLITLAMRQILIIDENFMLLHFFIDLVPSLKTSFESYTQDLY